MVASIGEANRVLGHPFAFGLQISSAAKFSGVLGLLGGILYLIMEHATDCYLASVCLMGCREGVECKFLMSLRWMRSRPSRQRLPRQAVYTFSTTEVGICGVRLQVGPKSHL